MMVKKNIRIQNSIKNYSVDELSAMSAAQVRAIAESLGLVHQNKSDSIAGIVAVQK